jgi:hypothetical protein
MIYQVYYQRFFSLLRPAEMREGYLNFTHRFVKQLAASSLEEIYRQMQAEHWSPRGEARTRIASLNLAHTSLSVGDVVRDQQGTYWVCNDIGWLPLQQELDQLVQLPRLWLATLATRQGRSRQITYLKISDEKECLPPDAYTVESFGWTAFEDMVTLAKKLEQYPGFAPGVQVCIDLGDRYYETET